MNRTSLNKVWIGLGTNLGDRIRNLENALNAMEDSGCRIQAVSGIYESEPWGFESEHIFYNQSVLVYTHHSPQELLKVLKEIEVNTGREVRKGEYADRIIDLDILFYDELVLQKGNLILPHPHLQDRLFVLHPLAEISPDKLHPVTGIKVSELLENCNDRTMVRPLSLE